MGPAWWNQSSTSSITFPGTSGKSFLPGLSLHNKGSKKTPWNLSSLPKVSTQARVCTHPLSHVALFGQKIPHPHECLGVLQSSWHLLSALSPRGVIRDRPGLISSQGHLHHFICGTFLTASSPSSGFHGKPLLWPHVYQSVPSFPSIMGQSPVSEESCPGDFLPGREQSGFMPLLHFHIAVC